MEVDYKSNSLKKICTNAAVAERTYGQKMAEKIHLRIDQIESASTVEELIQFHVGRCHMLTGDRKNQYAMDLVHPMRLVFVKRGNEIQIARIIEIVDYH